LTKVRATVVESVVNFVNADFQDWVHALNKTRRTLIHVYRPDQRRLATGAVDVDLDPTFANDLIVSGRSKPASDGRLKTSHFEKGKVRRTDSSTFTLLTETDRGERTQDGRDSGDNIITFGRIVRSSDCSAAWR
jgi:hypothetical protein